VESQRLEALAEIDLEVHRTIVDAVDNRLIVMLMDWVFEVLQPMLTQDPDLDADPQLLAGQYSALADAIERRDSHAAEHAIAENLEYLHSMLRATEASPAMRHLSPRGSDRE
jgi:DNA-binding FadR family transcriptional regulator